MAMTLNKTVFLGALLVCVVSGPAFADEAKPQTVASVSGVTTFGDKTLQKAMDLIIESQKANEVQQRRDNTQPANQEHIVRVRRHSNNSGAMILGIDRASALPM